MIRKIMRIAIAFVIMLSLDVVWAQGSDPLNSPPKGEGVTAPADPAIKDPSGSGTVSPGPDVYKYYTAKFDIALWLGAIVVGGMCSFLLFLFLHRKDSVKGDWRWPLIPAIIAGYLFAMFPIIVTDKIVSYENWGARCFQLATYGGNNLSRDPNSNGDVTRMCVEAQTGENGEDLESKVSFSALGLNTVFSLYKRLFAGGIGNAMYPVEMHIVIWLLIAVYSLIIYFSALIIRQRIFIR